MNIAIIAGIGNNRELGKDNTLLWNLPNDMKHFRDSTRGHAIIMGRKTFESFPNGPLPGRQNIVISRDTSYEASGVTVVHSLGEAVEKVDSENYPGEVFIIGGAQIYKEGLPLTETLYITHIHAAFPHADTFFPEIDPTLWKKTHEEKHMSDENHAYDFDFVTYKRV